MVIEIKDIEHLAGLARIAISDSEKEILKNDLEEILVYVSQIKEISVEIGEQMVGKLHNVMRDDSEAHESCLYTDDILSQAPTREGDRVLVKKIL